MKTGITVGIAGHVDHGKTSLAKALLSYSRKSGMTPFSADTFWKEHEKIHEKEAVKELLNYLYNRKKLVRPNDHRVLSLEAIDEIKARVTRFVEQHGYIRLTDCKAILGSPMEEAMETMGGTGDTLAGIVTALK